MKVSRNKLLIFGLAVIALVYFCGRARYLVGSKKVDAVFAFYITEPKGNETVVYPILEYTSHDSICQFRGREGTSYSEKQQVPVLLINKDSENPMLYTFTDFWLYPIVYSLLPVMLWSAFCLSFLAKNEYLFISSTAPYFRRERKK
jgi:hypothetical protein